MTDEYKNGQENQTDATYAIEILGVNVSLLDDALDLLLDVRVVAENIQSAGMRDARRGRVTHPSSS